MTLLTVELLLFICYTLELLSNRRLMLGLANIFLARLFRIHSQVCCDF